MTNFLVLYSPILRNSRQKYLQLSYFHLLGQRRLGESQEWTSRPPGVTDNTTAAGQLRIKWNSESVLACIHVTIRYVCGRLLHLCLVKIGQRLFCQDSAMSALNCRGRSFWCLLALLALLGPEYAQYDVLCRTAVSTKARRGRESHPAAPHCTRIRFLYGNTRYMT